MGKAQAVYPSRFISIRFSVLSVVFAAGKLFGASGFLVFRHHLPVILYVPNSLGDPLFRAGARADPGLRRADAPVGLPAGLRHARRYSRDDGAGDFEGIFATQRGDFAFLGLLVGVLAVASALFTYYGTRENPVLAKTAKLPLLKSLAATFSNTPYLLLVFTSSCTAISNYTTIAVIRYLVKYFFQREDLYPHFFAAFFVGVFISIPLWIKVINRIGKKSAYIFTMSVYAVILWLILLLGPQNYVIFGATMVIAGAFNIGLWLIPGSILPDVIEWDQLKVGERREGAFYGIWTLIRKSAIGGAFMIIGYLLAFVGYVPNAEQTPRALFGIKMLFGPIPSILLIIGIVIFLKYPITKEVHRDIVRRIHERQKET
jgi:GPH family glycoside/pentoside/hexuronide:cation symporter